MTATMLEVCNVAVLLHCLDVDYEELNLGYEHHVNQLMVQF